MLPRMYTVVSGSATGPTEVSAFDAALADAGVADLNLVPVSSILPPDAIRLPEPPEMTPGTTVHAVLAKAVDEEKVAAAVAVAHLEEGYGVISERTGPDADTAEELALEDVEAMAETRNSDIVEVEIESTEAEPDDDPWASAVALVLLLPGGTER
ncbi:MAG: hypothetical protein GXO28_02140 [Methanopyri archaeon]|nr:hypothetical protein [Methanopyri archaeon]